MSSSYFLSRPAFLLVSSLGLAGVTFASGCAPVPEQFFVKVPQKQLSSPEGEQNVVCDPLGQGGSAGGAENGVRATLKYLGSNSPQYSSVSQMQAYGVPVDAAIYFNRVFVPTRMFSEGFATQDGTLLQNAEGETLFEWFTLRFESVLKLAPGDPEGIYELSLLSDDGATLSVDEGAGFQMMVDNDGTHPTQLGCASRTLELNYASEIPIRLDYFQGPRYHIAVSLLWRYVGPVNAGSAAARQRTLLAASRSFAQEKRELTKALSQKSELSPYVLSTANALPKQVLATPERDKFADSVDLDIIPNSPVNPPLQDPLCGAVGNNLFFDPAASVGSQYSAQAAYLQLLNRGWEPIPAGNLFLSEGRVNPCAGSSP
ncbi:MAG: hypothetical protein AB7P04_11255 [Bacteriovoracia bacterium]